MRVPLPDMVIDGDCRGGDKRNDGGGRKRRNIDGKKDSMVAKKLKAKAF